MKKVKSKLLGSTLLGLTAEEKMANFIYENKLKKEDIIQIVHASAGYAIFYYVDESEES